MTQSRSGDRRGSRPGSVRPERMRPDSHRAARVVDPEWLDRLLVASCDMPISSGEAAIVEHVILALRDIFPAYGVGVCFVPAPNSSGDLGGVPLEQRVFKRMPVGQEQRADGVDPSRLFPGYRFEQSVAVESGLTTLHLASDDPHELGGPHTATMHLLRRAALTMRHGLTLARVQGRADSAMRELRAFSSHVAQTEKLASLGQIAAGVVHELNNPLTSIVAYTDWLIRKQGPSGDPDSLERLRRISESSSRILRFTRDLTAYARPSSGVAVPVSVQSAIERALAFCEHVLAEHHATVVRVLDDALPPIRGMPEQLAQVFVNLFTNACHAMPTTGGELKVSTSLGPDGRVWVSVEDNGHGIATEHRASIFMPFFTTKTDGQGTGLGLSIVRNIVDEHGGEIRVEPSTDGGARFILKFPVVRV
jgi:two-component system NtrC family sensor kinase